MNSHAAASVESKMATMQHKFFWVREFIKTESATAVQRAFFFDSTFTLNIYKLHCEYNQM